MQLLPEEPPTINAQLRQLPAYRALLPTPPAVPKPMTSSRVVAALMQLKDTVAILHLLSDGSLLFGIICGFGVPGLVLYGLRWRQVRGQAGRGALLAQAVLSLLHELFWVGIFYSEKTDSESFNRNEALAVLYALGALLSMAQLVLALGHPTEEDNYYAGLTAERTEE